MHCDQVSALLSALIDREISFEDRALLDAHLKQCPACAAAREALQAQDAALKRAFAPRRRAAAQTAEGVIAQVRALLDEWNNRSLPVRLLRHRWRLAVALTSAAALVAVALLLSSWQQPPAPQPEPVVHKELPAASPSGDLRSARARGAVLAPSPLRVGESVATKAGERRRLGLPDGSVLYVNEKTRVRLARERELRLESGEVFLEVAPRAPEADGSTFVVQAPGRTFRALGTKFAVTATDTGSGVVVTQGKVRIAPLTDMVVHAGQQVVPGSNEVRPAPRASHVLDWTRDLMAAAESPLVPQSQHGSGALVALDPFGQEARLSLRRFHVDVHIEDGFARTTIDQTYFNHNVWRMEGTFYFPLPPDASLSRLAMYVANGNESQLMEGGMAERDHARNVFEQIVYTQRDPALLEWLDGSTFKMRVFPLEGRQEKRIILSYTQKLDSLYGRATYRFPAGHNMQLVKDWSFEVRVKGGARLDWHCRSHELKAAPSGGDLVLTAQARNVKPDRDIVLDLAEDADTAPAARFSSAQHEGHSYLMVRYRPPLPSQPMRQRRDWVFLFESGGDRDPLLARVQIEVIRTLLANAEHDDTFAVVTAATRTQTLAKPQAVTAANVQAALEALERVHLVGALDLGRAIAHVRPLLQAGEHPCLVHVGSGIAALGERQEDVLAKQLPDHVPYVGVGVGKRWSRRFMKLAAERSGGHFTQINPDEPVGWRAFELAAVLNTPRLHNVRVVDEAEKAIFLSHNSSLAQGEELCAIARIPAGRAGDVSPRMPKAVTITGVLDGKTFTQTVPVAQVAPNANYLPRTWARLEIDRLLADDAEKNKQAIIELSKAMYVMTPFTSLLVLENDAMYQQFEVDRGRKDHWAMYNCPPKIPTVYEPDPSQGIDRRFAPPNLTVTAKPSAEQIKQTILVRVPPRFFAADRTGIQAVTAHELERLAYAVPLLEEVEKAAKEVTTTSGRPTTATPPPTPPVPPAPPPPGFNPGQGSGLDGGHSGDIFLQYGVGTKPRSLDGISTLSAPMGPGFDRGWPGGMRLRGSGIDPRSDEQIRQNRLRELRGMEGRSVLANMPSGGEFRELQQAGQWGREGERKNVLKQRDGDLADSIIGRLLSGHGSRSLIYQRPGFGGDPRLFSDLLAYAPGMNTSQADILAVLEAEAAADPNTAPGRIDPGAQKLIDRARAATWQSVTMSAFPARSSPENFELLFDGSGRYCYERVTPDGLREQVICDGKTILHLYPELGVGARRSVSRFHRAEFAQWLGDGVLPVEDLARGHDVRLVNDHTVALVPRRAGDISSPVMQGQSGHSRPLLACTVVHLIFTDGRLAERRVLEMPAEKLLSRETFTADGTARLYDGEGKLLHERRWPRKAAEAPELTPDLKPLVVLPLPYRTWQYLWQTKAASKPYQDLDEETALALIGSALFNDSYRHGNMVANAFQVYLQRFHNKGERSLGFLTLLQSGGINNHGQYWHIVRGTHSKEPLGKYIASFDPTRPPNLPLGDIGGPKDGFLQRLAAFRDLYVLLNNDKTTAADLAKHRDRALDYVRQNRTNVHGWAILSLLHEKLGKDPASRQALAEACKLFFDTPGLAYAAKYEYARSRFADGQAAQARALWRELYRATLQAGSLPLIDSSFREALQASGKDALSFRDLARATAKELISAQRRLTVISLATQCRQLDEPDLADELVASALAGLSEREVLSVTLAGVEYYWQSGQQARADEVLHQLLKSDRGSTKAALWHLAAALATQQKKHGKAVAYLDRAMEIEYGDLPKIINLQQVRTDHARLLHAYQQVAYAHHMLDQPIERDFIRKVVRIADRWRSLDPEPTLACQSAARILKAVGANELAWDYLTTPCALHPNEAAPHLLLAQALRQDGDIELANRAYAVAFAAEPTNAQILWDQAQMLQQAGRHADALNVYRRLADGDWQPRFQGLKQQAKWQLGAR